MEYGKPLYFRPVVSSSFFFLIFLAHSQPSWIGCIPYFHTWCGLSANLGCRSEVCCTWLAENTGCKNRQKFAMAPSPKFVRLCLRNWGIYQLSGKNLLNSNISSTCFHNMAHFGRLTAEIGSEARGTPANFNGFRVLSSSLHQRRSPEVNQTLHDAWPSPELVHYIYTFRGSCLLTEFARWKIHLTSKSCVLLYWQRYYTAVQQ